MYVLLSIASGIVLDAIVMQRTAKWMRVIAPGFSDVLELRRKGQTWLMEGDKPVEFEFLADLAPAEPLAQQTPMTMTAASAGLAG